MQNTPFVRVGGRVVTSLMFGVVFLRFGGSLDTTPKIKNFVHYFQYINKNFANFA